jgi:hypothetical protein
MFGLGKIAEFFVQFTVAGVPDVAKSYADVGRGLGDLARKFAEASAPMSAIDRAARNAGDQYKGLSDRIASIKAPLGATFGQGVAAAAVNWAAFQDSDLDGFGAGTSAGSITEGEEEVTLSIIRRTGRLQAAQPLPIPKTPRGGASARKRRRKG